MQMNEQKNRFELEENGHTAFADYRLEENNLIIPHVEAPPELRGTGAAGRLMEEICQRAKAEGWKITPLCSYAASWIRKHGEYCNLLA